MGNTLEHGCPIMHQTNKQTDDSKSLQEVMNRAPGKVCPITVEPQTDEIQPVITKEPLSREEISAKCSEYLKNGFKTIMDNGRQGEFIIFLMSHYPRLHKFFGIDVLKAEHLEMNPRYQELGEKQVASYATLIETYPNEAVFKEKVSEIIRTHEKYNLTIENYKVFWETTLGFLHKKDEVNIELDNCWMIVGNEFCEVARPLLTIS